MHRAQLMMSPSPFRAQPQTSNHTRIARSPPSSTSSHRQNPVNVPDISGGYDSLTFGSEGDNDLIISTSSTSSSNDIQTGSKRRAQEVEYDDLYYDEPQKVKESTNQVGIKKNPFLQKPNDPIINPFAVSNEPNDHEEPEAKKAKTTKENKKVAPKRQAKLGEHFGNITKETANSQGEEQEIETIGLMTEPEPETYGTEDNEEQRKTEIAVREKQREADDIAVLETNVVDKEIEEFNDFEGDLTESQYLMDFDLEQNSMDLEQIPADYDQDPSADPEEA